ncbi:TetR family transcriptional regulator [Streptomyces sp. LHD-70]|uniref:TetR/AcrR family transcriptional regulator n=1 Tax=Streptomyces sp. LHD-70 TaxID=3072140 RepID=UPI00280D4CCF|nr:TetR family transcriptional regulator [Streptomyces sp. LHD-70]MDQ8705416.1 TetR family transcriptional regulator [Streptomyces sp. LHD-70]
MTTGGCAAAEELAATEQLEVAAVVRRAGVSVGLPYRYFGTRSGLLIALAEDFHERLGQASALSSCLRQRRHGGPARQPPLERRTPPHAAGGEH